MCDDEVYCSVHGKNLNVVELEKRLTAPLRNKTIRGELMKRGIYRGQPSPYGSCNIGVPENIPSEHHIEWLADYVTENLNTINELGADQSQTKIRIVWKGVQGNMELSASELHKLAALNLPLCMDYIFLDPEDDE